jgi:hypothetical protein
LGEFSNAGLVDELIASLLPSTRSSLCPQLTRTFSFNSSQIKIHFTMLSGARTRCASSALMWRQGCRTTSGAFQHASCWQVQVCDFACAPLPHARYHSTKNYFGEKKEQLKEKAEHLIENKDEIKAKVSGKLKILWQK